MKMIKKLVFALVAMGSVSGICHGMQVGKYQSEKSAYETIVSHAQTALSYAKTSLIVAAAIPIAAKLVHFGLSYYPSKWFDAKAGNKNKQESARWFADLGQKGHSFDVSKSKALDNAITAITPYAPQAREINEAFEGNNDQAKQQIKQKHAQTRTCIDMYRWVKKSWPQGVEPKTLGQVLHPLIYVNGKEANELLIQLLETRKKLYHSPASRAQPANVIVQNITVNR